MILANVIYKEQLTAAKIIGNDVWKLPSSSVEEFLKQGLSHELSDELLIGEVGEATYGALFTHPAKIFCTGINYQAHIKELNIEAPKFPTLFAKFHNALTGPRSDLKLFDDGHSIDWEAELVIAIGKKIKNASLAEAGESIAGFCVANDVSARNLQLRSDQWLAGKTIDRSSPIGPWLVTPDEVGINPELEITCSVNDEIVQHSNTKDLLFKPVDLIQDISRFCTLEPGDLIYTGTPGGIGAARSPQWFLKPGDILKTEIESLGMCVNRCL